MYFEHEPASTYEESAATVDAGDAGDDPVAIKRGRSMVDRWQERCAVIANWVDGLDLAPDLAQDIGSARWMRGMATLIALTLTAFAFWPGFAPLKAAPNVHLDDALRDEYRSQMILPLGLGADSGRRMGPTRQAIRLKSAPERPELSLVATLSSGDGFARMLQRAGVGSADANRVQQLIGGAVVQSDIPAGTQIDITLGRRPSADAVRPLQALSFRARFDLQLSVTRDGGNLSLVRRPIRVDETPLRISGTVGPSLYRSARAAGAPPGAVQRYLATLGDHVDLDRAVAAGDVFDIIVSHRRAATGERQAGELLYAGVERAGKPRTQLMRWGKDGKFFEASGVGEQRTGMLAPVPGPVSSNYGMRRHPILGYRRMHSGMDFKARHGTPIVAPTDGRVTAAGRMGGCGNAVRLAHAGNLATRYCHMSRIAVRGGDSVRRGQIIGYVGSTGLSTGPHLHYEMYRGGASINPASVQYVTRAELSGGELARFRAALAKLKTVPAGAALAQMAPDPVENAAPKREIDRLNKSGSSAP